MTLQTPERTSTFLYVSSRLRDIAAHPACRRHPGRAITRLALWGLHCALGIPARARFRRWNFRLYLPSRWRGGGSTFAFVLREFYEPELMLLEKLLKPGMVVVDAGASTGIYTFAAAALVGDSGRVVAIEPGVEAFAALRRSTAMNRADRVILREQALSSQRGAARVVETLGQPNMLGLASTAESGNGRLVETVTLDGLVDELQLTRLDFLKLDVEGAQELVLEGGRSAIQRFRPVIRMEISPAACRRLRLDPTGAPRLLVRMGYQLYSVDFDDQLIPLGHGSVRRDVLAIHTSTALPGVLDRLAA